MQNRTNFLMLLAMTLAGVGNAEDQAGRLLADLDADQDGQLSRQEAGRPHGLLFDRLLRTSDDDGDGRLSADELALALQPVRAEKAVVEKVGSRMPGSDALVVLLAKMDVNRDQTVSPDEVPQRFRAAFDQLIEAGDETRDGALDSREVARRAPQLAASAVVAARRMGLNVAAELARLPPADVRAMRQMDAFARTGPIISEPARSRQRGNRSEANRGGDVPAAAASPPANRVEQLFRRLDRDGDGQLTRREGPPRIKSNFDRLDRDGSGKLTVREMEWAFPGRGGAGAPRSGGFGSSDLAAKQPAADSKSSLRDAAAKEKRGQKRGK